MLVEVFGRGRLTSELGKLAVVDGVDAVVVAADAGCLLVFCSANGDHMWLSMTRVIVELNVVNETN